MKPFYCRMLCSCLAVSLTAVTASMAPGTALASQAEPAQPAAASLAVTQHDAYGVPHIFASTQRALFEQYGFEVVGARLWQMEMVRRAASGRLSEIFGAHYFDVDRFVRSTAYTHAELQQQFTALPRDVQQDVTAYVAGINRALTAPENSGELLPLEFRKLQLTPAPWQVEDVLAVGTFMLRRFGEVGGHEVENFQLLQRLKTRHGARDAERIFDDLLWRNDPEAPVTIASAVTPRSDAAAVDSSGGARLSVQGAAQRRLVLPDPLPDQDVLLGPQAFDRVRRELPPASSPGNPAAGPESTAPQSLHHDARGTAGVPRRPNSSAKLTPQRDPSPVRNSADLQKMAALGALQPPPQAAELWARLGVPSRLGSYAWAIAPKNSASGEAMLYGGPQMGFSAPEIVHEVQLSSADGFNAIGMAFAGVPYILIGHNKDLAWTSTTAVGDNVDIYHERLCDADAGQQGTCFNGACVPLQHRRERIEISGAKARDIDVWRSPHGPALVVPELGIALSQRRAHWQREAQSLRGFKQFNLAADLPQFAAGIEDVVTQHNFLYADRRGNIAYWQAGELPRRPAGFDFRLPLPGDGSAEWLPELQPTPCSINPPQGFLANWNSKPCADFDSADNRSFGKQFRQNDLLARLQGQKLSWEDMHDIATDIARVDLEGRKNRYLQGYLQEALDARAAAAPLSGTGIRSLATAVPGAPASNADAELPGAGARTAGAAGPDASAPNSGTAGRSGCSDAEFSATCSAATELLRTWSGESITHAVHSTTELAAHALFDRWIVEVRRALFEEALGKDISSASLSLLVRLLDRHLGPSNPRGLPMRYDYLHGKKAAELQALLCTAFDAAVAQMVEIWGSEVQAWTPARPDISLQHPLFGVVGSLPLANRATYAQVLSLSRDGIWGENIFSTGQSGRVTGNAEGKPVFDPHFADLLPLFKKFEYKRMRLLPWPGSEKK